MVPKNTDMTVPEFEPTPVQDITAHHERLRATFRSGRTKDIQFRLKQLRKLYWACEDLTPTMLDALAKDVGKSAHEAIITDVNWCKNEALTMIKNLEKWAKDSPVANVPPAFWLMKYRVRHEPLGTVLVVGSYNYPFQLSMMPAIGAIAAGNTLILKPSEGAPRSAMIMKRIFDEYLDPDCYVCVNGALEVSQALLDLKFDKIAFTGGRTVGRIVAMKAAETLTPVLLELGGQNPAFVTKNANIKVAARRLLWAKTSNCGQACVSQNYVLVERSVLSELIGELNKQSKVFMPQGAKASPDYGRMNNINNFNRVKKMLDETRGKIVLGGTMDESQLFIEPTAVLVDSIDDSMMTQESFGPIFSIYPYDNLDDAIDIANKVDSTPLCLYTFGSDAENKKSMSGHSTITNPFLGPRTNIDHFSSG